jgi:hypothetical protein
MGRHQFGKYICQKTMGCGPIRGFSVNMQSGNGMEGGHGNATGGPAVGYHPEIGFRKVISQCLWIKNNLRNHSIGPLIIEKGKQFLLSPCLIKMRDSDRNKGGIPIPLMRIE